MCHLLFCGAFAVRLACALQCSCSQCTHVLHSFSGLQGFVGAMRCMGLRAAGLRGGHGLRGIHPHFRALWVPRIIAWGSLTHTSVICREKSVGGSGCSLERAVVWAARRRPIWQPRSRSVSTNFRPLPVSRSHLAPANLRHVSLRLLQMMKHCQSQPL